MDIKPVPWIALPVLSKGVSANQLEFSSGADMEKVIEFLSEILYKLAY
jgi:hypothetical protein